MTDRPPTPLATLWLRRLPILAIAVAAVVGLVYFRHLLNFETLRRNREWLVALRDAHYALTSLAFLGIYTLVVITSIPGALISRVLGSFAAYNILVALSFVLAAVAL